MPHFGLSALIAALLGRALQHVVRVHGFAKETVDQAQELVVGDQLAVAQVVQNADHVIGGLGQRPVIVAGDIGAGYVELDLALDAPVHRAAAGQNNGQDVLYHPQEILLPLLEAPVGSARRRLRQLCG